MNNCKLCSSNQIDIDSDCLHQQLLIKLLDQVLDLKEDELQDIKTITEIACLYVQYLQQHQQDQNNEKRIHFKTVYDRVSAQIAGE